MCYDCEIFTNTAQEEHVELTSLVPFEFLISRVLGFKCLADILTCGIHIPSGTHALSHWDEG